MTRAVVLGAGGQLGRALAAKAAESLDVSAWTRADFDVTDTPALRRRLNAAAPDIIFNCSAWARVDEAEDDPVAALAVNAWAVRDLARIATERGWTLVHFSSDFVFDGIAPGPYDESTAPNPRGAYASSKLMGEWFASDAPRHYVLRVESLFGGPVAKSTIDGVYSALMANREVRAFADRTVSPSYVHDVAGAAIALATGTAPFGLYHCVNSGQTTWLNVAGELARLTGRPETLITPVTFAGLALKVPRPLHAALSNAKLRAAGIVMPTWQDALARHVRTRLAKENA